MNERFKIKRLKDPLENIVPDIIQRKVIWWFSYMVSQLLIICAFLFLIFFPSTNKMSDELSYTDPFTIIMYLMIFIYAISYYYYGDNNLRKRLHIKLYKYLGVKNINKKGKIVLGTVGNGSIKSASYIEPNISTFLIGPFIGHVNPKSIKKVISPDYMSQTSQANLFALITTPFNIELSLQSNNILNQEIKTECQEINYAVSKYLKNSEYYHWRIVLNKKYLTLQIVGGAWQGEMFAKNIEIGLDMFKELINKMKDKYHIEDWENYIIYWDKPTWQFHIK